jgi:type IV secretory pathway VirB6-like protein
MDFCYYSDDFGDSGDFDVVNIMAAENSCYYDTSKKLASNTNETIKSCLKNKSLSELKEIDSQYEDSMNSIVEASTKKCSDLDMADTDKSVGAATGVTQDNANFAATNLFSGCVDACQNSCASTTTPDASAWIKANVKKAGSYVGIRIEKDVYVSVTVSGTIVLDSDTNSAELMSKNLGLDHISYSSPSKDGETIDLSIDIEKTVINNSNFSNIGNILARGYVDFIEVRSDLAIEGEGNRPEDMYKFQRPNYSFFSCLYDIDEDGGGGRSSADCRFRHDSSIGIASTLDNYYNNLYKAALFKGDYYVYASNLMDMVRIGNDNNLKMDPSVANPGIVSLVNNDTVRQILGNLGFSEGFVWNNLASDFSPFSVDMPVKIAIKYIGRETTGNCSFSIAENESTGYNVSNGKTAANTIAYVHGGASGAAKWQTIKASGGEEMVFNRYSTKDHPLSSTIKLSSSTSTGCTDGLAIKLLPLKEYRVQSSGLLFLYIPSLPTDLSQEIAYTLINPDILRIANPSVDLSSKFDGFFEDSSDFRPVAIISSADVTTLDYLEQTESTYNALLDKSIFVREGQVLRLDYSNWLDVDGRETINVKQATAVDPQGNQIYVGQGIGLSAFVKEKLPYFCYGKAREAFDLESACMVENGTYSEISLEGGAKEPTCFVPVDDCTAKENTLVGKFRNVNYRSKNCKHPNTLADAVAGSTSFATKLSEFWNTVYVAYSYLQSCNETDHNCDSSAKVYDTCNDQTEGNDIICKNCYDEIVKEVYDAAVKCKAYLSGSNSYSIYKGIVDGDGNETHRVKASASGANSIAFNASITGSDRAAINSMVDNLLNLFVIEEKTTKVASTEGGGSSESYTNYSSHFYYYKELCPEGNGSDCGISLPQCYSLKNYKGNFKGLFERIKSNSNAPNVDANGYLTDQDVALGAEKLKSFNIASGGLMKNFVKSSESTSTVTVKFNKNIYSQGSNFIRFFVIKEIGGSNAVGTFDNLLKKFNSIELFTPYLLKISLNKSSSYKNGERLAVFIGNDGKDYTGNPGNVYSGGEKMADYGGSSKNTILEIVKYRDLGNGLVMTGDTKFKFDSAGLLRTASGGYGIDFSDPNFVGNEYFDARDSDTNLNMFFKIADTNNSLNDNSGSYQIRIRTVNRTENVIVTYFRDMFNLVLGFIDGSEIPLRQQSGSPTPCPDEVNVGCVIYSEDDVSKNGNSCSYRDAANSNSCYEDCRRVDTNVVGNCKRYADGRGFVKVVFENFIGDPLYQFVAKLALVLMITLYGFGYFFGLTNFTQSEIMPKVIRVCFIYFIISPSGWDFFNKFIVKFFKDGVDSILFLIAASFETSLDSELSVALATRNYSDKSVLFSTCFSNLKLIFSDPIFNKMLGLAFSSWFGLIYLYLVFTTVINYVVGVFSAITMYLNSQVYISLTLCFFPLVVLFMFFERTKKTLDNWVNLLISFAGQQIFLIMTLSFFNILIYNFIKATFSYTVCWLGILNMNIAGIPLSMISFWKIPTSNLLGGLNTINESMPSFYSIMSFYIVGVLMSKFMTGAAELGSSIFGATGSVSIGGGMAGLANGMVSKGGGALQGFMKSTGTGFAKSVAGRMGGNSIKKYGEEQTKKRNERKQMRGDFLKNVDGKTEKGLSDYKNSAAFQEDLKKKEGEDAGFKDLSSKEQKKRSEKLGNELLQSKEKEIRKSGSISSALESSGMQGKIEEHMHSQGVEGRLADQSDEKKNQYAEEYLKKTGLM